MAGGDTLVVLHPTDSEAPPASYATFDMRNGHPVLDFDDTSDESAVFSFVLPRAYDGGGLTVHLHFSMTAAVAGTVRLDAAFERMGDGIQDVDTDGFAAARSVIVDPVPATSGLIDVATISFADGSEIDGLAAGELGRLKITRVASDAPGDTAGGDLELHAVEIRES